MKHILSLFSLILLLTTSISHADDYVWGEEFKEGDIITGPLMAQSYTTMPADFFTKVSNPEIDPFTQIGILGVTTGLTAYFGIYEV